MKQSQEKVRAFCDQYDMEAPAVHRLLDLISELGEVAKELLLSTEYGKKPMKNRIEIPKN